MKKILIALSIIIAMVACNQEPDGYTIEGNLTGELENGTKIFLKKQGDDNQLVDIDTTTVENGKFAFNGVAGIPEVHYILIDQMQGYAAVVLENGEIEFSAQKDSLGLAKIKGTPQNDAFSAYLKKAQAMTKRGMAIQQDRQTATASNDQAALSSLNDEMVDFQEEYKSFEVDFIKANPTSLISVLLLDKAITTRTVEPVEVQGIYDTFSPEIKETKAAKRIAEQLPAINEKAGSRPASKSNQRKALIISW